MIVDDGVRVVVANARFGVHPVPVAFRAIAERVDVELAPKRRYRTELKIV